jgi:exopolysaccharide biosynthesis protein
MQKIIFVIASLLPVFCLNAQLQWKNVDSLYAPLPASVHVYKTTDLLDGKSNIAYYVVADLKDKKLNFTADTSKNRRLTPTQFYEKNKQPLLVVNTTFFSFTTNKSLNVVIKDGRILFPNSRIVKGKGADSARFQMPHLSAIGIKANRKADIAWIKADTLSKKAFAIQTPPLHGTYFARNRTTGETKNFNPNDFKRWKVEAAVGGGPVLLQSGDIKITNEEEMMFTGKAINDKHPRTAMGYTKDNKLIILVVEGRHPGIAEGATLTQLAQVFKDLGCREALNLDGGGSSCMLVNGKETITVSDKEGQRSVPAVFIIQNDD